MTIRRLLIAIGLFASTSIIYVPARATGQVMQRGRVIDAKTGNPVVDAEVMDGSRAARTDSAGVFRLPVTPPVTLHLIVRKLGFEPAELGHHVALGDTTVLFVLLRPGAALLTPVRVVADSLIPPEYRFTTRYDEFFRRRAGAIGGHFFTRDQIDARGGVGEAIRTVPGVRVTIGGGGHFNVRMIQCPADSKPAVVVDGVLSSMAALTMMPTAEIEMIEVYHGAANMPPETRGNACGALVIYTK